MADSKKKKKQVVLVVEGTAAVCPYWPTILEDDLNNLIRSFCDNGSSSGDGPNVEFAIVVFNARESSGSSSTWLLRQSNWTNDVNCLMKWLSAIDFSSSDTTFPEAATAQGLTQALMLFRSSNEIQNDSLQRHCILVAASNPDSPDAEKVAKLFPQSNISLSVISPSQLPKLGAISNAGKRNPSVASGTQVVWEGDLYGVPLGKRVLLTRLQAYMNPSASKLVKDWPSSIQIDAVSQIGNMEILQKEYAKKAYFVLFHATHDHEYFRKLQKHKLCGVIKLPSQIVLFTVTNNPSNFLGMIFTFTPEQQEILFKKYGWNGNGNGLSDINFGLV